jgi:serine/threonine-protein kinase RsbW
MEELLREKQSFEANLIKIYDILNWIVERVSKFFNQKDIEKIQLATEEAVVNIIKHGYKKKKAKIEIELIVNQYLSLIIKDSGPKFNPLSKKQTFKKKKSTNRKPGGLGIFLIFQCVDEVSYARINSFNILTLKKKRSLEY